MYRPKHADMPSLMRIPPVAPGRRACVALACSCLLAGMTQAEDLTLEPVVITATRSERKAFDLPASADAISKSSIEQAGPGVNLSEALARVPGMAALNRQNYAQDLQIQSRGFGARSTFGVRGVRLYADGIPATMPDGQGQSSTFDLDSAGRIEVLRGPFSTLWGNASGGVIQVFSEDGPPRPTVTTTLSAGSDGFAKAGVKLGGSSNHVNYLIDLSHFDTDGYRDHSAAERNHLNAKLGWQLDDAKLTLVLNALHMPGVQDPLGLTQQQYQANPQAAGDGAVSFNTRKNIDNRQIGMVYERKLGRDELRLMSYYGQRQVTGYQSIPICSQVPTKNAALCGATSVAAPRSPGGVVDLNRQFAGLDARYTLRGMLASRPASVSFGTNLDHMREHRLGFNNYAGNPAAPTAVGVEGNLRRDEDNRAANADQYLQAEWEAAERFSLSAGVRHSSVRITSHDHYITTSNGDDSGGTHFDALTPVLGLVFHATDRINAYASLGRSFETPTLNEVAYQPSGTAGLNLAIQPSKGDNYELGIKARATDGMRVNAALFDVETRNEIGVFTNSGGRSAFQNVGNTRRSGAELSFDASLAKSWTFYTALTYLQAIYRDSFRTCTAAGCLATSTNNTAIVPVGKRIPGTARRSAYAELAWAPVSDVQTALELRHSSKVYADDLNTQAADGYTTLALRASWQQHLGGWMLKEFARVDNLLDKHYVGSVVVNESNKRYFEPAPGRSWLVGVQAGYAF